MSPHKGIHSQGHRQGGGRVGDLPWAPNLLGGPNLRNSLKLSKAQSTLGQV